MAVFKCKMCGASLDVTNQSVIECEYCGTQQTLPKLDDDRRANLYDRANHFRRNNEFDKAAGIYEQILNEDTTDAEAYWSLVLCRYGIEYVEDPATRKRVPTVNRAQFTSVYDDDNYKSALQHADSYQRSLYEQEANAINEIQKGILAISQQEEPFDIFICYKESDANGRRTPDSVLANDLYHQLTQEGFKVFFARITLEDKLGSAYEPYIFAALNSAKVMVVLGTKPEYFTAVWVKNEWSRYLSLIKQGQKKMLIPAYKDMDPYDLPDEFSHLQAQDMTKLGFMQDLIRGIKKITQDTAAPAPAQTVVVGGNTDAAPLLRRAFMFLEDGDFASANDYCEKVLDIDPENAMAYVGKLMAALRVKQQDNLKDLAAPYDTNANFQKAVRFGDQKLVESLWGYIEHIKTRNENERLERIYPQALAAMEAATTEDEFLEAAALFETVLGYKDADALATSCYNKADAVKNDEIFSEADAKMHENTISGYLRAIELFESIAGWKNADEKLDECRQKLQELKAKFEAEKRKKEQERLEAERKLKHRQKITNMVAAVVAAVVAVVTIANILITNVIVPAVKYNSAVKLMDIGKYTEAIETFEAISDYKDSDKMAYEATKLMLKEAKVGDRIPYGTRELDGNEDNGEELVYWIVLDKKDGELFLLSEISLEKTTFVRAKLLVAQLVTFNGIELSKISSDIAMLTISECEKYLPKETDRQCVSATGSAIAWWLTDNAGHSDRLVWELGTIDEGNIQNNESGVRPAMWIDLSKL